MDVRRHLSRCYDIELRAHKSQLYEVYAVSHKYIFGQTRTSDVITNIKTGKTTIHARHNGGRIHAIVAVDDNVVAYQQHDHKTLMSTTYINTIERGELTERSTHITHFAQDPHIFSCPMIRGIMHVDRIADHVIYSAGKFEATLVGGCNLDRRLYATSANRNILLYACQNGISIEQFTDRGIKSTLINANVVYSLPINPIHDQYITNTGGKISLCDVAAPSSPPRQLINIPHWQHIEFIDASLFLISEGQTIRIFDIRMFLPAYTIHMPSPIDAIVLSECHDLPKTCCIRLSDKSIWILD